MSLPRRLTEPSGRQAELFKDLPNGKVQCTACARLCQIGEGQVGLCGVRGVVQGKLYLLVYGKIIAGHVDPIEKKPLVHYRPGSKIFSIATTGCNWLCHPAGTRILLSDGQQRNVEDVLPGDKVWSYGLEDGMKIHPSVVTHVGRRRARLWEVRYGVKGHARILLTEEHPILTKKGWKTPNELTQYDSILKVWCQNTRSWKEKRSPSVKCATFTCRRCGEQVVGLEDWDRHRGECYTRGIDVPAEVREARRQRMLHQNPMKSREVAARALESSRARFLNDPTHGWHRNVDRIQVWLHRHPSQSQTLLYHVLDELGVPYQKEHRIVRETSVENELRPRSYYLADAAFPEARLDIEVDGWWHYNSEEVKQGDNVRDAAMRANGWDVLRISGSYLRDHREEVKALIIERLGKPVMVNRRAWMSVYSVQETQREEEVFGLETIPDHNYVADEIVVHNCQYCQNADISQRRRVEGMDATPEDVVSKAEAYGCEGLAYTYNQPTIFIEYAKDVGKLAHRKRIFNLFVSNGFDTPETVGMMKEFLDCITVDFKGSGRTDFVRRYIGVPDAEPIFQTLLEIKNKTRIHLEITDLIVPGLGDDLAVAEKLCRWINENLGPDTPVHFLRFHPDYKMMDIGSTPVETLEKHYRIGRKVGLNYVYIGNVPGHPAESTYCPGCGRALIRRFGYEILEYNLDGHNSCKFCGHKTPIVGPLSKSSGEDRFIPVIN